MLFPHVPAEVGLLFLRYPCKLVKSILLGLFVELVAVSVERLLSSNDVLVFIVLLKVEGILLSWSLRTGLLEGLGALAHSGEELRGPHVSFLVSATVVLAFDGLQHVAA